MSGETFWDGAPEPIRSHLNEFAETYDAPSPDVETVLAIIESHLSTGLGCRCERWRIDTSRRPVDPRAQHRRHVAEVLGAALRGAGLPEPSGGIDFMRLNHGLCPRCGEDKFIGHGPLCPDCFGIDADRLNREHPLD